MKTHHTQRDAGEIGTVWFVVPMVWVAVALAGLFVIGHWPGVFTDEAGMRQEPAAVAAPYAGGDPVITPAADHLVQDGSGETPRFLRAF